MQGGVVFRAAETLWFLPATIAVKVMPMPDVASVPGAPPELCGVALVDGETLPVVSVGQAPRASPRVAMIVLAWLGEHIGLVGVEVLATGRYELRTDHVEYAGHEARLFDVGALVARISASRWAV